MTRVVNVFKEHGSPPPPPGPYTPVRLQCPIDNKQIMIWKTLFVKEERLSPKYGLLFVLCQSKWICDTCDFKKYNAKR